MTFEQLKAKAKKQNARIVGDLDYRTRNKVLKMAMYAAECDEYFPDLKKVIEVCDNSFICDIDGMFEAYKEGLKMNHLLDRDINEFTYYDTSIEEYDNDPHEPTITDNDRAVLTAACELLVENGLVERLGSMASEQFLGVYSKLRHWDYLKEHKKSYLDSCDPEDVCEWESRGRLMFDDDERG